MYLRRIEIQGFKSFAGRTTLEFGRGLTAVVGPNGSGKSNIVDAVRWVLGEQSTRNLRARRMEDVIFSGSSKRPSVGMAEISITLDNADGWLPIDFSEVVVTRRAFRSGETEYLLNRNKVRLREILDLLMKANVAQDSYAIMGQSMVEQVLSLKPEDRRVLFEEAAGVRPYRARMEEATDRLAATRENLERVKMLIAEIAPRLGQLEKQAQRAQENARLSRELSQALQAWYGHQWEAAQEGLVAARARLDQLSEAARSARERAGVTESRHVAVRDELERLRPDARDREAAITRLAGEVRDLEQSVAVEGERVGLLRMRREELLREIEALEADLGSQIRYAEEDAEQRRTLEQELHGAEEALAGHQSELHGFDARWREARSSAAEAQERAARAAAAASEIARRIEQDAIEMERLGAELERLGARKADLDRDLAALGDQEAVLKGEEEQVTANLEEAISQHQSLKRLIVEGQSSLSALEDRFRTTSRELAMAESRAEAIRASKAERESVEAGLRELTGPDGELAGIVGTITSLIQVPRGMERAIEAALAEHLRAVVVDRPESALAAIQTLLEQGMGNVTVIPILGLRDISPLNLHKEKGVVGVAAKLVRCDAKYRRLVDTLLGRTIVVDDVRVGRDMLRRALGTVVTVDGVLLRPIGSMSLGPGKAVESQFVRDMQLAELPGRIEELQQGVAKVGADAESKRQAVQANESAIVTIGQKVDNLRSTRAAKIEELTALRGKLAQLRGEMRWLVEAQHQNRDRIAAFESSSRQLRLEREGLMIEAEDTAKMAEQQTAVIQALQQQRDMLLRTVSEAGARVASLAGEQKSIALVREKQENTTSRAQAQIASKRTQERELETEIEAIVARHGATERTLIERREQLVSARGELGPVQARWQQLDEELAGLRDQLVGSREALLQAERDEQDAAGDVHRKDAEIETLRETIASEGLMVSDHGQVVSEALPDRDVPEYLRQQPTAAQFPPLAGGALVDPAALKERIGELRTSIRSLGPVNQEALTDYEEGRERHDFLVSQVTDLDAAEASLRTAIAELEGVIRDRFKTTFDLVASEFERYFTVFFGGGHAELQLTPPADHATSGIEIVAQPPGKKLQGLALLSGGERALTAVALLFALLRVRPVPFVLLDEVDAALDEANVNRFADALLELAGKTQFIVVTHNRRTIERADTIYGVSMGDDSVSRMLSLRLSDLGSHLN